MSGEGELKLDTAEKRGTLWIVLWLNVAIAVGFFVTGIAGDSNALLANDDLFPTPVSALTGGSTPSVLGNDTLNGVVVTPGTVTATLQGAVAGMQRALTMLRDQRRVDEDPALVTPFAERQRLVGKPEWDALEKRYT